MSSILNPDDLHNINQFLEIPYKDNLNSQMNTRYKDDTEHTCESKSEQEDKNTCDISNPDDLHNINQFLEIPYKYNLNSQIKISYKDDTEDTCESKSEQESENTCDARSVSNSACVLEKPNLHIEKQLIIPNTHIVSALNHLFKYNEEFIKNEKMSFYKCDSNYIFTWIYMHMPIIRQNIPNNPKYDPIRLMDEVDLSIGIIGINKFPQILNSNTTQIVRSYNIILIPSEYQTFRRKIKGMGIDILACDERRCTLCNAYLAFLNVPYIQI